MTLHTNFRKGTPLFVIFKDGTKAVDKFEEKKGSFVILRNLGSVRTKRIRSLTIFRHLQGIHSYDI